MATRTVEGFSVVSAELLAGPADVVTDSDSLTPGNQNPVAWGDSTSWGDVFGVRTASITPDSGNYDNTGNDFVRSSWYWLNYATVTVEAGYVPFDTLAKMSGTTVTTTGSGDSVVYSVPLWNRKSLNTAPRPMRIHVDSKDSDGIPRVIDFILFKVQLAPFSFTGPAYKAGLLLSYTGRALLSAKDEKGVPLPEEAIGRMVSGPVV